MIQILNEMKEKYTFLRNDDNVQKVYHYFKDKKYIAIFYKQFNCLISNLNSIEILVNANSIEDAFTIFRKYLETYFTLMSVINHPDLVQEYLKHDQYITNKLMGYSKNEIKELRLNHIDGFIEYGYIDKYLNERDFDKYTMHQVAKVAGVEKFYNYYKKCNNFVHNNLTSVNVNLKDAESALSKYITNTIKYLLNEINKVING